MSTLTCLDSEINILYIIIMNIYNDMCNLYPMCRSITGESIKKTLEYIQNTIPIKIHSIKSGEQVFDLKIPRE